MEHNSIGSGSGSNSPRIDSTAVGYKVGKNKNGDILATIPIAKDSELIKAGYDKIMAVIGPDNSTALHTWHLVPKKSSDKVMSFHTTHFTEDMFGDTSKHNKIKKTGGDVTEKDIRKSAFEKFQELQEEDKTNNTNTAVVFLSAYMSEAILPTFKVWNSVKDKLKENNVEIPKGPLTIQHSHSDSEIVRATYKDNQGMHTLPDFKIKDLTGDVKKELDKTKKLITPERFQELESASRQCESALELLQNYQKIPDSDESGIKKSPAELIKEKVEEINEKIKNRDFSGELYASGTSKPQYESFEESKKRLAIANELLGSVNGRFSRLDHINTMIGLVEDPLYGLSDVGERKATAKETELKALVEQFQSDPLYFEYKLEEGERKTVSIVDKILEAQKALNDERRERVIKVLEQLSHFRKFLASEDHVITCFEVKESEEENTATFKGIHSEVRAPLISECNTVSNRILEKFPKDSVEFFGRETLDATQTRRLIAQAMIKSAQPVLTESGLVKTQGISEAMSRCFVSNDGSDVPTNSSEIENAYAENRVTLDETSLLKFNDYLRLEQLEIAVDGTNNRFTRISGVIREFNNDISEFKTDFEGKVRKLKETISNAKILSSDGRLSTEEDYKAMVNEYIELLNSLSINSIAGALKQSEGGDDWKEMCEVLEFAKPLIDENTGLEVIEILAKKTAENEDRSMLKLKSKLITLLPEVTNTKEISDVSPDVLKKACLKEQLSRQLKALESISRFTPWDTNLELVKEMKGRYDEAMKQYGLLDVIGDVADKRNEYRFTILPDDKVHIEMFIADIEKKVKVLKDSQTNFARLFEGKVAIERSKKAAKERGVSEEIIEAICKEVEREIVCADELGEDNEPNFFDKNWCGRFSMSLGVAISSLVTTTKETMFSTYQEVDLECVDDDSVDPGTEGDISIASSESEKTPPKEKSMFTRVIDQTSNVFQSGMIYLFGATTQESESDSDSESSVLGQLSPAVSTNNVAVGVFGEGGTSEDLSGYYGSPFSSGNSSDGRSIASSPSSESD